MTLAQQVEATGLQNPEQVRPVKVVVWDLDHTLWNGVLLEDPVVQPRPGVLDLLHTLDARGILQSIASRNEPELASQRLRELGIDELFLCPQIGWGAKSHGVARIATRLNLALSSFLFVDDQPFERAEVQSALPDVRTLDAAETDRMVVAPELNPAHVPESSRERRRLYQTEFLRQDAEASFQGPTEEFLRSLSMRLVITRCASGDLRRAEELTQRTNQLNTTGYTYDFDELDAFRVSPEHLLLVAGLDDRFGSYGTIGLALIEKSCAKFWTVKLLLISCRVQSRGVGAVLISDLLQRARDAGVTLRGEFRPNGRNRMMHVAYRFSGFREIQAAQELVLFEHEARTIPPYPDYVHVLSDHQK